MSPRRAAFDVLRPSPRKSRSAGVPKERKNGVRMRRERNSSVRDRRACDPLASSANRPIGWSTCAAIPFPDRDPSSPGFGMALKPDCGRRNLAGMRSFGQSKPSCSAPRWSLWTATRSSAGSCAPCYRRRTTRPNWSGARWPRRTLFAPGGCWTTSPACIRAGRRSQKGSAGSWPASGKRQRFRRTSTTGTTARRRTGR